MFLRLSFLAVIIALGLTNVDAVTRQSAPNPSWPDKFTIQFYILVEQYGSEWKSTGILYYDWNEKVFRSDFINWCLPLFDSGSTDRNNYTCSFLASNGSMYFVNATGDKWENNECCLFQKELGPPPPDWMTKGMYNGTSNVMGKICDTWWFPGTSDPSNGCFGYWNDKDNEHYTPVQFFGLSSLGPTILDYFNFMPGLIPPGIDTRLPNDGCKKECVPPSHALPKVMYQSRRLDDQEDWPFKWPSC